VRVGTKPHASVNNDTTAQRKEDDRETIRDIGTKRAKTRMKRRVKSEESGEEVGREATPSYHSRNEKLT
jgi:hypothetical protein